MCVGSAAAVGCATATAVTAATAAASPASETTATSTRVVVRRGPGPWVTRRMAYPQRIVPRTATNTVSPGTASPAATVTPAATARPTAAVAATRRGWRSGGK